MNQRSGELTVGRFYAFVALGVFVLAVLCLLLAVGLAVYADEAGKPGGAAEDSVNVLWRCVFLFGGTLAGLLASPKLAAVQRD